jgi:lipopolysaccharide export system permease protein
MRLLDRYLLRELLVPLGLSLGGLLIFYITFDLFGSLEDFQSHKLHGLDVIQYYVVKTPEILVTVVPVALLVALLYSLTSHARHNELTAIRASGVGLWRMCLPYLAVGFAFTVLLFFLNELWIPNTDEAAKRIMDRYAAQLSTNLNSTQLRNGTFQNGRDRRLWHFGLLDPRADQMSGTVEVDWQLSDGSRQQVIANRAEWTNVGWVFYDVTQNYYTPGNPSGVRTYLDVLPMPTFSETPEAILAQIKMNERFSQRSAKRADIPLMELLAYHRMYPQLKGLQSAWFYTKLHGRFAVPWTCFVVVLVAIPFGAAGGRRSVFVGVASSIVICFAYFVLQQVGLALATQGFLPPWLGAWTPNVATGATGLLLARKIR